MFGGFHIEMTAVKSVGDVIGGSGWTQTLAQTDTALVVTSTVDSFLYASHLTRTR